MNWNQHNCMKQAVQQESFPTLGNCMRKVWEYEGYLAADYCRDPTRSTWGWRFRLEHSHDENTTIIVCTVLLSGSKQQSPALLWPCANRLFNRRRNFILFLYYCPRLRVLFHLCAVLRPRIWIPGISNKRHCKRFSKNTNESQLSEHYKASRKY